MHIMIFVHVRACNVYMYLIFKCFHGLVLIPILQSLQNPAKSYFVYCIVVLIQISIGSIGFLVY